MSTKAESKTKFFYRQRWSLGRMFIIMYERFRTRFQNNYITLSRMEKGMVI